MDINIRVLGRAAIVLGALNSEIRVKIVKIMIETNPMTARELLEKMAPLPKTSLSNHLSILCEAGLVENKGKRHQKGPRTKYAYVLKVDKIIAIVKHANALAAVSPGDLIEEPA